MLVKISGFNEMNEAHIPKDLADPVFRKATANMMAAYLVCKKALSHFTAEEKKSFALIVSTQFGEVSSSLDFLTTYYDLQIAKPILFQNSLHNSTLGFITIQLGLTGPALTLSADERMDEAINETARGLLSLVSHVLVCQVDIVPDFVKENYAVAYPHLKNHLGWARAFVISQNDATLAANSIDTDLSKFIYSQSLGELLGAARV